MTIITTITCDYCGEVIPQIEDVNNFSLKGMNKSVEINWHLCDNCYEGIFRLVITNKK